MVVTAGSSQSPQFTDDRGSSRVRVGQQDRLTLNRAVTSMTNLPSMPLDSVQLLDLPGDDFLVCVLDKLLMEDAMAVQ